MCIRDRPPLWDVTHRDPEGPTVCGHRGEVAVVADRLHRPPNSGVDVALGELRTPQCGADRSSEQWTDHGRLAGARFEPHQLGVGAEPAAVSYTHLRAH